MNNTNHTHDEISQAAIDLIPWYATGNISEAEKAFFEKALEAYPVLREELSQEQEIINLVSSDTSILEKSAIAPTEERLKSVLNLIEVEEQLDNKQSFPSIGSFFAKLKSVFDSFVIPNGEAKPQHVRVASFAVVFCSLAILFAFSAPIFNQQSDFVPASAKDETPAAAQQTMENHTSILVGFSGTPEALGKMDVLKGRLSRIHSVPDKEGIYKVHFNGVLSAAEIQQTIDVLTSNTDSVWFAGEEF